MNPFAIDESIRKFGSRFDLVIAAAKRAGQLRDGAPPLIETTSRNSLTIALEEIAAGKVLLQSPPAELLEEPEPLVQDYLTRRGSLQDAIGVFDFGEDDEDELDEDLAEELDEELEDEELEDEEVDLPLGEEEESAEEDEEDAFGFDEEEVDEELLVDPEELEASLADDDEEEPEEDE
jgi:DNA-directed RNA polymerase subunit omega